MENLGEIIIYQTDDGLTKLDVRMEDETVWLTQQQMAELFQTSRTIMADLNRRNKIKKSLPESILVLGRKAIEKNTERL